jgi:hypothetical protein
MKSIPFNRRSIRNQHAAGGAMNATYGISQLLMVNRAVLIAAGPNAPRADRETQRKNPQPE